MGAFAGGRPFNLLYFKPVSTLERLNQLQRRRLAVSNQFLSTSVRLHSEREERLFSPPTIPACQRLSRAKNRLRSCVGGDDRSARANKLRLNYSYAPFPALSRLISAHPPSPSPDLANPAAENADKSHSTSS
jgi:hypothetical protein